MFSYITKKHAQQILPYMSQKLPTSFFIIESKQTGGSPDVKWVSGMVILNGTLGMLVQLPRYRFFYIYYVSSQWLVIYKSNYFLFGSIYFPKGSVYIWWRFRHLDIQEICTLIHVIQLQLNHSHKIDTDNVSVAMADAYAYDAA